MDVAEIECIYGYGIVDKNKNVIVLWNVVCVERKMFGNTCVIICI